MEARELDHILEEMAILQARSEMYFKFVRKKAFADIDSSSDNTDNDTKKKNIESNGTRKQDSDTICILRYIWSLWSYLLVKIVLLPE